MGPVITFIASLFAGEAFSEGVGSAKKGINRQITEKEFTRIVDQFDQSFIAEHDAELAQYAFDIQIVKEKRALLVSHAENYLKQDNSDFKIDLKQEYIEAGCEVIGDDSIVVKNYLGNFYDLVFWKETKEIPDGYRALVNAYANKQHDINRRLYQSIKDLVEANNDQHVNGLTIKEPDVVDFTDFYNSIGEEFTEEKDNSSVDLLGSESDDSAYIEQYITTKSERQSVLTFLSNWFAKRRYGTLLICGEPGHGKSLLCKKAVVEFKRENFLKGKAKNVLFVSLNTGENPGIIQGNEVIFDNMLSWGPIREHRFKFEDCRESLLFMDGFDEFIDEAKKADIKDIVSFMNTVEKIAKSYKIHIVVLSRSIAVQKDLNDQDICNKSFVLTPITKEQQTEWVNARNNYIDYNDTLMKLQEDKDMSVLLGIPLLFRMIVHTHFDKSSSNEVELYNDLFDHLMRKRGIRGSARERIRKNLSNHAYEVYCNDEDTSEVVKQEDDENWVFAFYVKSGQEGRVGFFHRSFYQYYLARYIYEGILNANTDRKAEKLIGRLAERELDNTVRRYLSLTINKNNKETIHKNLKLVIEALVRTEAFLNLKPRYCDGNAETTKLGRCINIYRNTVHISAAFSYVIEKPFKDGLDDLLRTYPSKSIKICSPEDNKDNLFRANLSGADLSGANLSGADLSGADLRKSYLREANLRRANLSEVILSEAHLPGATMKRANLSGANLSKARLTGADLSGAKLNGSNLSETNLGEADLRGADLRGADLSKANLRGADLRGANLNEAHLSGANLKGARLRGANLGEAQLSEAYLKKAHLSGAHLREAKMSEVSLNDAYLKGAFLRGAKLSRADLSRANLSEADLSGADLSGANLSGAKLSEANLSEADLSGADLSGANLNGAKLRRADMHEAKLSRANLHKANLNEAKLTGVDMNEANLSEARLFKANLSGANLRFKCIDNAFIDSDKKELIDSAIRGYETIVWVNEPKRD